MKSSILILLSALGLILLQSCSAFKKTVELDMQPFSDNTTVMFQEAAKVDRPFQFKALAAYKDVAKFTELKEEAKPIINALKGISYYSNQLVAISNSPLSQREKNEQLALYVKDVLERVDHQERLDKLGLTYRQVDSTIVEIKKAETYREGIKAADPAIKSMVLSLFDRLSTLEIMIADVIQTFEEKIYNDHELAIKNYYEFKSLQDKNQYSLTQLYAAQSGLENSLDSLIVADKALAKYFPSDKDRSQQAYQEAEEYLLKRLTTIDSMLLQLEDDKVEFMDIKREISEWHIQADEKIKIARNSLIVWSQSHKNLGQGVVTPAILGIENIASFVIPLLK